MIKTDINYAGVIRNTWNSIPFNRILRWVNRWGVLIFMSSVTIIMVGGMAIGEYFNDKEIKDFEEGTPELNQMIIQTQVLKHKRMDLEAKEVAEVKKAEVVAEVLEKTELDIQKEAIKLGYGKWVVIDDEGNTEFRWDTGWKLFGWFRQ